MEGGDTCLLQHLHSALRKVGDVERAVSRVAYRTATPKEVVTLLTTFAEAARRLGLRLTVGGADAAGAIGGQTLVQQIRRRYCFNGLAADVASSGTTSTMHGPETGNESSY